MYFYKAKANETSKSFYGWSETSLKDLLGKRFISKVYLTDNMCYFKLD